MHFHQESVGARNLLGIQYRPHPGQARWRTFKAGEPHVNFAGLEFHCISQAFHDAAIIAASIAHAETGFLA
jgi:hypothetical protein